MKRFILYLFRWQLSTPILWLVVRRLGAGIWSTIFANLIGGTIFFWVDRFIFTSPVIELWQFRENGKCHACGKTAEVRRLIKTKNYDRTNAEPVFLCPECSKKKLEDLKHRGINASDIPK